MNNNIFIIGNVYYIITNHIIVILRMIVIVKKENRNSRQSLNKKSFDILEAEGSKLIHLCKYWRDRPQSVV